MYILEKTIWDTHKDVVHQGIICASDEPSTLINVIDDDEDSWDGILNEQESSDLVKLYACASGKLIQYMILEIPYYG